ncbi:MAG: MgtC/SapB family protein [Verrucomicrobiales bacterium]|nr:MgtC/SapB family protein [Verrucomicrobiales bacterium]
MTVIEEPLLAARQLGVALGLGLLVGLQRERAASRMAGIRTFPMVTVFGFLCAFLSGATPWLTAAGLLAVSALLVVGHLSRVRAGEASAGLTTEAAAVTMYAAGAALAVGETWLAVCVGGGVAVLLHLKPQMQALATRIGEDDFRAIMQFALITLVILPVLPNETMGPYEVLNPFKIWLLVVLIVGLSLAGYVAYQFLGESGGTLLAGILGGVISSTATTVSFARRARAEPQLAGMAALVIAIASTVVFGRVLLIIAALSPALFAVAWPPLTVMGAGLGGYCGAHYWMNRRRATELPRRGNPSELKSALFFAFLFAIVLLAVAAARAHLGTGGLYAVSVLSGLTDMDAITLSTTDLAREGRLDPDLAWRLILVAGLANLVFKAGVVVVVGGLQVMYRSAFYFALALVAGLALLFLWP